MTRLVAVVAVVAAVIGEDLGAQVKSAAWVQLGNVRSGVQNEPYKAGQKIDVATASPTRTGRTPDGLVVSCLSVYGWRDGATITVVVLVGVPAAGKENRFYDPATGDNWFTDLQFTELARYNTGVRQGFYVEEMNLLGLRPTRLSVSGLGL